MAVSKATKMTSVYLTVQNKQLDEQTIKIIGEALETMQFKIAPRLDEAEIELFYTDPASISTELSRLPNTHVRLVSSQIRNLKDPATGIVFSHSNYFEFDCIEAIKRYVELSRARAHVLEAGIRIRREQIAKQQYTVRDLIGATPMQGLVVVQELSISIEGITQDDDMQAMFLLLGGTFMEKWGEGNPTIRVSFTQTFNTGYVIYIKDYDTTREPDTWRTAFVYTHIASVKSEKTLLASVIRIGVDALNANCVCVTPNHIDIRTNLQKSIDKLIS